MEGEPIPNQVKAFQHALGTAAQSLLAAEVIYKHLMDAYNAQVMTPVERVACNQAIDGFNAALAQCNSMK